MAKSKSKLTPPPINENIVENGKGTRAFFRYLLDLQRNTELESGDIDGLEERVSKNETDISSNETRITANETSISSNSLRLDSHDVTLLDHESRISNNEIAIADHESRIDVIESERTRWLNIWIAGNYFKNDMVQREDILWIANKDTTEEPMAVGVGVPSYLFTETPSWTTKTHTATVISGHKFTTGELLFNITSIRFWVHDISATYTYRYIIIDNATGEMILKNALKGDKFTATGWQEFYYPKVLRPNTDYSLLLSVQNSSSETTFNHPYVYTGSTNSSNDPLSGNANKRRQNNFIRINKTDRNGIDRSADLVSAMLVGTTVKYEQDSNTSQYELFEVIDATDNGTYIIYDTTLVEQGSGGYVDDDADMTIYFIVPVEDSTDYVELTNGVSSYPRVQGDFRLNGQPDVLNQNGYAVDIELQEYIMPLDWDIMGSFNVN